MVTAEIGSHLKAASSVDEDAMAFCWSRSLGAIANISCIRAVQTMDVKVRRTASADVTCSVSVSLMKNADGRMAAGYLCQ